MDAKMITIPRAVLEQALSAIDWAADQIKPQSEEGCACPLCLVSPELEKALVCPVCRGVGYDSSGQRCEHEGAK